MSISYIYANCSCCHNHYKVTYYPTHPYVCGGCRIVYRGLLYPNYKRNIACIEQSFLRNFLAQKNIPTPKALVAFLDNDVVGQTKAKKQLAVCIYNHLKAYAHHSIHLRREYIEHEIPRWIFQKEAVNISASNLLLLGSTGSGKTHIISRLAKILRLPFTIIDATTLTETGYQGATASTIIQKMYKASQIPSDTQGGIVYIDEIDKIAGTDHHKLQGELLKLIEGTEIYIGTWAWPNGRKVPITINTRHILFIAGGTFKEIYHQDDTSESIGFNADISKCSELQRNTFEDITSSDVIRYGFLPELIGRFQVFIPFEDLDEYQLQNILTQPHSSLIKQYTYLFAIDGCTLVFTKEAIEDIAHRAHELKTGARGLRTILERILLDVMYTIPSSNIPTLTITKKFVAQQLEEQPTFHRHETLLHSKLKTYT